MTISALYMTWFKPNVNAFFDFGLLADDGGSMWIDGELAIDNGGNHAYQARNSSIGPWGKNSAGYWMQNDTFYNITLEYYQYNGAAVMTPVLK
eukprot:jgi/Astpho2/5044/Aster-x0231